MRVGAALALVGLTALSACTNAAAPAFSTNPAAAPPAPRAALSTTSPAAPNRTTGTYVVRNGDTLSEIAAAHRVDMGQLARLNNIAPPYNSIRTGQTLLLPGALVAGLAPTGQLPLVPQTIQGQIEILSRSTNATTAYNPATAQPFEPVVRATTAAAVAAPVARQPAGPLPNPPARSNAGFIWPLKGAVASTFGTKGGGVANDGIDIRAAAGTPVVAVDNGVVAFASDELKALGNLVLIQHSGNWVSAYANAGSILVRRGDTVTRGQQIATAGQSGNSKASGIHFELRRGTTAVDPQQYLTGGAIAER